MSAHGGLRRRGGEYVGPCPLCGGDDRFRVLPDGAVFCRICLPDGKDPETLKELGAALGLTSGLRDTPAQRLPDWSKAPRKRLPAPPADSAPGAVMRSWTYETVSGSTVTVKRIDTPGRPKVLERSPAGVKGPYRPLLRRPDDYVEGPTVIVEGETSADAVLEAGYAACCWIGGSGSEGLTDWTGVDGDVVLWPDADEEGRKVMGRLADLLKNDRTSVRIVDVSGLPDGHDAVDVPLADRGGMIEDAEGWKPPALLLVSSWYDLQSLPPVRYVADGLLLFAGLSLLIGHPKAGKSTLARVIAAETAGYGSGMILGRSVVRSGRVLYYAPDEHQAVTRDRFARLLPTNADGIDFMASGTPDELASVLRFRPYRMAVIDTLGRLFQSEDFQEGDNYLEWQKHMDMVRKLAAEAECHICMLHHARKSGGSRSLASLGSTAIPGGVDTVLSVEVTEADSGEWARYIQSTNRAGREIERRKLVLDEDGWLTAELDQDELLKSEIWALRKEGKSIRAITDATGVPRSTVHRVLNRK